MNSFRVTFSGVRNETHVIHLASWLRQLLASGASSVSVVDFDAGRAGSVDAAVVAALLPRSERLDLVDAHLDVGAPHYYVAVGAPGIKPWIALRSRRSTRRFRTVVVDEGIGSYGTWRTRRSAMRREGGREPWVTCRAAAVAMADRTLTRERWQLYVPSGDRWTVNDAIAEEFRRHCGGGAGPPRAVFLSQPWVELGLVDGARYVEHLEQIAAEVARAGVDFQVRPHPAEQRGRYRSFEVLPADVPAELDRAVVSASLVLGETSTALLNVAAVFGVPALRVPGPLEHDLWAGLGRRQRAIFEAFVPPAIGVAEVADAVRRLTDPSRRE